MLIAYRTQDWDEAEKILNELLVEEPDCFLYNLYLERIAVFRENPSGRQLGRCLHVQDKVKFCAMIIR